MNLKVLIIAGAMLFIPTANAAFIASVGFAPFGGDNLVQTTEEDLEAGTGLYGDLGFLLRPASSAISYQATIGLKANAVDFDGGDADIVSLPMNMMIFYNNASNLRFGIGATYELGPEFTFNAPPGFSDRSVEFDDALGFAIEVGYFLNEKAFLGARYTALDYEVSPNQSTAETVIDANNLGIHIGIMF